MFMCMLLIYILKRVCFMYVSLYVNNKLWNWYFVLIREMVLCIFSIVCEIVIVGKYFDDKVG